MILKKLDKKSLLYLGIVLAIAILVAGGLLYYISKPMVQMPVSEKESRHPTKAEILKSLTAPKGEAEPVSKEIINNLSVPAQKSKPRASEEVLKNLTAPE